MLTGLLAQAGPVRRSFGVTCDNVRLDQITDPMEDDLGIEILAGYRNIDTDRDPAAARHAWHADLETFRHSNRMGAIDFQVKLACVGLELVKMNDPRLAVTDLDFVVITTRIASQDEHTRWMAERLLAGWSFGPRSDSPPRRPSLCTWEVLKNDPATAKDPARMMSKSAHCSVNWPGTVTRR